MSDDDTVISFADAAKDRLPERGLVENRRRYDPSTCRHSGPYLLDENLANIECGDCGAFLNPMFVLKKLCDRETYYNDLMSDKKDYLAKIDEEIKGRERTKCTHCGNMTAIKYKNKLPQTWTRDL